MPSELASISPIDGRYQEQTDPLSDYFSEAALIRYRIKVELDYFKALTSVVPQLRNFPEWVLTDLFSLLEQPSPDQLESIKDLEKITHHDVKAVEYYLKQQFQVHPELQAYQEWIHFGLTSQDINQTALALQLHDYHQKLFLPTIETLTRQLSNQARDWTQHPMLARTHGQPASPTTMGKEILVFADRLDYLLPALTDFQFHYKFGGATGNFNAHYVAFPQIDWVEFAEQLYPNLHRTRLTTQIEPYDYLARYCHYLVQLNTVLIDLCRDIWQYISDGYFQQMVEIGQVGSSAMPHKINPIDFENAEGNLGLANALLSHFATKLPISRLQRDLTDSTVVRNLGVAFSHGYLAYQNLSKGINKLTVCPQRLVQDLDQHWEVLAEAIQTVLRRENYPRPYETLRNLTQSPEQKVTQTTLHQFIDSLEVDQKVKEELKELRPETYLGNSLNPLQS